MQQSSAANTIPIDTLACEQCEIVLDTVQEIAVPVDDVRNVRWPRLVRLHDGTFLLGGWGVNAIQRFDPESLQLRVLPLRDVGSDIHLSAMPGGGAAVWIGKHRKLVNVRTDGTIANELLIYASVFGVHAVGQDTVLVQAQFRTADMIGHPVHVASFEQGVVFSFGEDSIPTMPGRIENDLRSLGYADSGRVWVARHNVYEAQRYTYDGLRDVGVSRSPPWFPAWEGEIEGEGELVPPRPFLLGVQELHGDILVAAVLIPDSRWQPGERDSRRPDETFDTVLEVLNARSGSVLGSVRIDGAVLGFAASDMVYFMDPERRSSHVVLRVARVRLTAVQTLR